LALVRQRGGLAGVIVARDQQHAAMLGSARRVRVLEDVPATIDAGALAVPHAEDAVVLGALEDAHLLRAPYGRRGELLVDAGDEVDVVAAQVIARLPEGL